MRAEQRDWASNTSEMHSVRTVRDLEIIEPTFFPHYTNGVADI